MSTPKPHLVRRRLGRRLAKLRDVTRMTPQHVHDANISISRAKLGRIERGEAPSVAYGDVLALCELYKVEDPRVRTELTRMAQATTERGWWEPYGRGVPAWFQLYVELESDADRIWIYESEWVNGLFQIPEYMRAVYEVAPSMDAEAAEKAVELRLNRQRDFWSRHPLPDITVIMSEAVLQREVAGSSAHAKQLDQLRQRADQPGIRLFVVPNSVGAHPSMSRTYTMMDFDNPDDPDVVYTESIDGCRYDESPEMFSMCRVTFDATQAMAVPIKEF